MALKRYRLSIWKNGLASATSLPSARSYQCVGAVHPLGERGEVQRQLLQAVLAQELGGARDHELGQAVRGLRVAAHERQRHRLAPVARDEVENPADRGLVRRAPATPASRRRAGRRPCPSPSRSRARARPAGRARARPRPARASPPSSSATGTQLGGVAGLAQPRDRLADLADRPALERELVELDHRLVAEVQRPQPELLVQRAQPLAGADAAELQPARLGERRATRPAAAPNASSAPTGSPESSSTPFSIR